MKHTLESGRLEPRVSVSYIFEAPVQRSPENKRSPIFPIIDVPSFFQPWINFCYYLLLIPFKIERNEKAYYYTTNCVQMALCGIIQPIVCVNALFEIRGAIVGKVRDDPAIFIHVVDRTNTALFCYLFFYMIWFRKDAMVALFNDADPKQNTVKIKRWVLFFCCILLTFSTFAFVSSKLFSFEVDKLDLTKGVLKFSHQIEFEFGFTRNAQSNPRDSISPLMMIITIFVFFIRFYKFILVDFLISMTGLTAFVCFQLSMEFRTLMVGSSESGTEDLLILNSYAKLKDLVHKFNKFIGPTCVCGFGSMISFCAVSTVDILDSEGWNFPFIMIVYFSMSSSMMIFSAEAHYQMSYFRTWLITRRSRSLMNVLNYLEAENSNLAIKGGRLFTITYGFLGTVSSVVLTYAIIMIQFSRGGAPGSELQDIITTSIK